MNKALAAVVLSVLTIPTTTLRGLNMTHLQPQEPNRPSHQHLVATCSKYHWARNGRRSRRPEHRRDVREIALKQTPTSKTRSTQNQSFARRERMAATRGFAYDVVGPYGSSKATRLVALKFHVWMLRRREVGQFCQSPKLRMDARASFP